MKRYPFAPLAEAMGETEAQACRTLGVSGSTEKQYRTEGLSERTADRLATRAGWNPVNIWPDWGTELLEKAGPWVDDRPVCPECDEHFTRGRRDQVYCSARCRCRRASRESRRRRWAEDPEYRERTLTAARRYRDEVGAEGRRRMRRAQYRANGHAERERARERYRANAEEEKAKRRARYWAQKEAS
ncbi:hypothetical protein PO878_04065 [Iamia majanohamensis]|uniref:Uncharacterized protein n=1 Tax=Iamia majanohamensis TaxID=467976 RepID=A0AAF0BWC3_9ACTN|nr:hypothetical protein [Iamia majanohamensis]WCO67898.1 hypothetical protein PO878_04065 [Iamia majanohamensis]